MAQNDPTVGLIRLRLYNIWCHLYGLSKLTRKNPTWNGEFGTIVIIGYHHIKDSGKGHDAIANLKLAKAAGQWCKVLGRTRACNDPGSFTSTNGTGCCRKGRNVMMMMMMLWRIGCVSYVIRNMPMLPMYITAWDIEVASPQKLCGTAFYRTVRRKSKWRAHTYCIENLEDVVIRTTKVLEGTISFWGEVRSLR